MESIDNKILEKIKKAKRGLVMVGRNSGHFFMTKF